MIQAVGHLHHVDGQFDVHVALDLASARGVGELLGRLGHDGVAVVVQPIDQRPDGGVFLIIEQRGVVEGAHHHRLLLEHAQQRFIIDIEAQSPGCCVEVGAVDEEGYSLLRVEAQVTHKIRLALNVPSKRRRKMPGRSKNTATAVKASADDEAIFILLVRG